MSAATARVFISYKRGTTPDESLARQIVKELSGQFQVFIDQLIPIGEDWGRRIEQELNACDFLVALLSADAVRSEMVQAEIETAHKLSKDRSGGPAILPIRVAFEDRLPYPLSGYLNSINWTSWRDDRDTARVIRDLERAIGAREELGDSVAAGTAPTSGDAANPLPSSGVVRPISPDTNPDTNKDRSFYIERACDRAALTAIRTRGATLVIRASVQMGKSHLLTRITETALEEGKRVAVIDLQMIDSAALLNPTFFFQQMCARVSEELEQEIRIDKYWNPIFGNKDSCTRYLQQYLLPKIGGPVTLIIDELDNILQTETGKDFVSMLRSWHNLRSHQRVWREVDLVLAARTEPYMWLDRTAQSPFNVGTKIELTDLAAHEVAELNGRYEGPLSTEQIKILMELVGGHPYLVRRFLYLAASGGITALDLFRGAVEDDGPFGDHLHYHLFHLSKEAELLAGMRSVIRAQVCEDAVIYFRLLAAGLVRRQGDSVIPRCRLYADYFAKRLGP